MASTSQQGAATPNRPIRPITEEGASGSAANPQAELQEHLRLQLEAKQSRASQVTGSGVSNTLTRSGSASRETKSGEELKAELEDGEDVPFNWKLFTVVLIAASSGTLFGYDLGLIGTIGNVPGFTDFYEAEAVVASPPSLLSPLDGSLATPSPEEGSGVSPICLDQSGGPSLGVWLSISLFLSGMLGGAAGSYLTATFGRRPTLVYASGTYTVGTLVEGLALNVPMFYIGRVIMGVGVGIANQVAPVYLAEVAPAKKRGAINISFQMFITFGILMATIVSFLFRTETDLDSPAAYLAWRGVVLMGVIPGFLTMYGAVMLTDTPQWIMGSKKEDSRAQAYYLLSELRQIEDVDREFDRMSLYCVARPTALETWQNMFLDKRRVPAIVVTTALVVFQQITFLNGFLFFLPSLFQAGIAGGDPQTTELYASLTNSIVNFAATTAAIVVADYSRRWLFMEAGLQMGLVAVAMAVIVTIIDTTGDSHVDPAFASAIIVVVMLFVSAYAWSWGPMPWMMPAELNGWPWRSAGTGFAVIVNFAVSAVIGSIFNGLLCALNYVLFILIAIIIAAATTFAYLLIPETAHVDLNETEFLFKGHWFWKRYYPLEEQIETLALPCSCLRPDSEPAEYIGEVPDMPTLTDLYGVPCSVHDSKTSTMTGTMTGTMMSRTLTPGMMSRTTSPGTMPRPGSGPEGLTTLTSRTSTRGSVERVDE